MDGILALGHFCETHGPCVVCCTQRTKKEPQQSAPYLTVPVCEACQSLDSEQAIVSKYQDMFFVTSRTPLEPDLSLLLKQAVVRSLSCEETSKEGGTLYFGDNERGHVISHTFTVHDSLARGFFRKYCILIIMKDKIHLLNSWPFLTKHVKLIAVDLQEKSAKVNSLEQLHKSQRAVRQAQGSPNHTARSLSQLTGEPAVLAHIHLWFTWILNAETVVEKPSRIPDIPIECNAIKLRNLSKNMPQDVFRKVCYCYLTGIQVNSDDCEVESIFKQILPKNFALSKSGEPCKLKKTGNSFSVDWCGCLPQKLPTLLTSLESALKDENLPDVALESYITSLIMRWHNIACCISWSNSNCSNLFKSFEVQKSDMPLLSYWIPQCKKINTKSSRVINI